MARPAWDEMTRSVDSGSVSVIVVKDISRLARNLKQIVELTEKCRVVTTDGAIDTDSATGGLLISILGSLASWEREQSVERQRISQAYRLRAGRAVGIARGGSRMSPRLRAHSVKLMRMRRRWSVTLSPT